jgi:hypothetical protein
VLTAAVIVPGAPLAFRRTSLSSIEEEVGGFYGAVARPALWRGGKVLGPAKLLAPDVGLNSPDLYPRHDPHVGRFIAAIGGPDQPMWGGTLAVVGTDSWEGGFEETLTADQIAKVAAIWRATTGIPVDPAGLA